MPPQVDGRRRPVLGRRASCRGALVAAAAVALAGVPARALPAQAAVIVLVRTGIAPGAVLRAHGLTADPAHVWTGAVRGFAVRAPESLVAALRADPAVDTVEPDLPVSVEPFDQVYAVAPVGPQRTPHGVQRIGATASHQHDGDGKGAVSSRLAVAVLDTGVAKHPDLDVVGGYDCTGSGTYDDKNGHGTHVAGTIAAKDDAAGVVGVAPGARIYAIRILGADGKGAWSDVICGLDWVYRHASLVDVASLSISSKRPGRVDDKHCGRSATSTDVGHYAACAVRARGVLIVAAAGNDTSDFRTDAPAGYPEVLTVTAMADFDGLPGGTGQRACGADQANTSSPDAAQADLRDDAAASYSNFSAANGSAPAHTVAAPGTCVLSTWLNGGYAMIQGTSMAAPHVTGLALLCLDKGTCKRHSPAATMRTIEALAKSHWQDGYAGSPATPSYDKALHAFRWYGYLVNAAAL
jgi:subtilisin family serine protease